VYIKYNDNLCFDRNEAITKRQPQNAQNIILCILGICFYNMLHLVDQSDKNYTDNDYAEKIFK